MARGEPTNEQTSEQTSRSVVPRFFSARRRPFVVNAAISAVPGCLLGFQLTGLLFFLNHHVPLVGFTFLRGACVYGAVLAGASTALVLPWLRGRAGAGRRALAFLLAGSFAIAGAVFFLHASRLAFYLSPEVNRRLLRAALFLVVAAAITFYTALVHAWQRRRYGPRSRIGLVLLSLLTIYVVLERRQASRAHLPPRPRPTLVEPAQPVTLVVVGVEGMSMDALLPLAEQGSLPFLAESLREGAAGRVSAPDPVRRLPAWSSLATGKYPYLHGVLDDRTFTAPVLRRGVELRLLPLYLGFARWGVGHASPVAVDEARRVSTLWEIGARLGVATAVFGWPGSQADATAAGDQPAAAELPEDLMGSSRDAWRGDHERLAGALEHLRGRPAQDHALAIFLCLPGLRGVAAAHASGFAAVQFEGSQNGQDKTDARALAAYYRALDGALGEIWRTAGPPRLLMVVSPYGADAPTASRRLWQRLQLGGRASELAGDGLLLLRGDGVRAGERLRTVSATDIAPTLLYGLGLPLARDFSGRLQTEAYDRNHLARTPLTLVPSFESVGPTGTR